jgi:hypothetical protein
MSVRPGFEPVDGVFPVPPACPACGSARWARVRFFPLTDRWPTREVSILVRCEECGTRRFFLPSGAAVPLFVRPRFLPGRLRDLAARLGTRALVVAASGTERVREPNVVSWVDWPRGESLEVLVMWKSLEEREDPHEVLAEARSRIVPGGRLEITTTHPASLRTGAAGLALGLVEPTRVRLVYPRARLAGLLRDAGFTRVRVGGILPCLCMRAVARP